MPSHPVSILEVPGSNVMKVQVGEGQVCSRPGYINELCTDVKICVPGTNDCEVISDVLVDTGSVGLRLFASTIHLNLPQVKDSQGTPIGECAQFGSGTDWGPLASADIVLADQTAKNATIHIIDVDFATLPSICLQSDHSPEKAGFNGILGVGLFREDCGSICETENAPTLYYSCAGAECTKISLARSLQVTNPVSLLPKNYNGVVIALPPVDAEGSLLVKGSLIFGLGTQPNNTPSQVHVFPTDRQGNFVTEFGGQTLEGSFIDSGTNTLLFPNIVGLDPCDMTGKAPGFYCPSGTTSFSATMIASSDGSKKEIPFFIDNAQDLVAKKKTAYSNIGATSRKMFDWGLPFFYGRTIYQAIEDQVTPIGKGPFWAY